MQSSTASARRRCSRPQFSHARPAMTAALAGAGTSGLGGLPPSPAVPALAGAARPSTDRGEGAVQCNGAGATDGATAVTAAVAAAAEAERIMLPLHAVAAGLSPTPPPRVIIDPHLWPVAERDGGCAEAEAEAAAVAEPHPRSGAASLSGRDEERLGEAGGGDGRSRSPPPRRPPTAGSSRWLCRRASTGGAVVPNRACAWATNRGEAMLAAAGSRPTS